MGLGGLLFDIFSIIGKQTLEDMRNDDEIKRIKESYKPYSDRQLKKMHKTASGLEKNAIVQLLEERGYTFK